MKDCYFNIINNWSYLFMLDYQEIDSFIKEILEDHLRYENERHNVCWDSLSGIAEWPWLVDVSLHWFLPKWV